MPAVTGGYPILNSGRKEKWKLKEKCESKRETSRNRIWEDIVGNGGHRRTEGDFNWIMLSLTDLQNTASKTISWNLGQ